MKIYVLTLSKVFPSTHKRAGKPTDFKTKMIYALADMPCFRKKIHTIRANYEFWHKRFEKIDAGEAVLSIREWVGKPYAKGSTQREIALLTREDGIGIQKLRIKHFQRHFNSEVEFLPFIYDKNTLPVSETDLANNDGLSLDDWREWFKGYYTSNPLAIIHFTRFRY